MLKKSIGEVNCFSQKTIPRYFLFVCFAVAIFQACRNKEAITPVPPPVLILEACGSHVTWGYTDKTSYLPGDEIEVFLQSDSSFKCGISFFDIKGSLAFRTNVKIFPQTIWPDEPWKNGFKFSGNAKIKLPWTLVSGI